jgi:hypothetical protein
MKNLKTTWDFVEKYFPNYSSSDEIAENGDLHKILNGQIEDSAEIYYNEIKEQKAEYFGNTLNEKELEREVLKLVQSIYDMTLSSIYEKAIEGFLENLKTN